MSKDIGHFIGGKRGAGQSGRFGEGFHPTTGEAAGPGHRPSWSSPRGAAGGSAPPNAVVAGNPARVLRYVAPKMEVS